MIEADLETVELDELLEGVDADLPPRRANRVFGRASVPSSQLYVRRNVLASQRLFEAAAERESASSSPRRRRSTGMPRATRPARTLDPCRSSPYGVTKLACEHLAYALGATAGLDAVGVRFFTVYGPRQRPDMAFTPLLEALAEGQAVQPVRRRLRVTELHLCRRRRRGHDRGDRAWAARRDLQHRRRRRGDDERGDRARGGDRRPGARSSSCFPRRVAMSAGRVRTSRSRARRARLCTRRPGSSTACAPSGNGPLLGSARHERAQPQRRGRSGRRAGG